MNAIHLSIVHGLPTVLQTVMERCREFDVLEEMCSAPASGEVLLKCYGLSTILPLHLATVVGNHCVIDCLVRNGCKLDKQDFIGNTIIHSLIYSSKKQSQPAKETLNYILNLCNQSSYFSISHKRVSELILNFFLKTI